jgi:hypothetical protein
VIKLEWQSRPNKVSMTKAQQPYFEEFNSGAVRYFCIGTEEYASYRSLLLRAQPDGTWRKVSEDNTPDWKQTEQFPAELFDGFTVRDDRVLGVTGGARVFELSDTTWKLVHAPPKRVVMWNAVIGADASGRLIAWGPSPKGNDRRVDETYVFDGGAWTRLPKATAKVKHARHVPAMFFHHRLRAPVLVGEQQLAVFDGSTWRTHEPKGLKLREYYQWRIGLPVAHDPATGATLVFDRTDDGVRVLALDTARATELAHVSWPDEEAVFWWYDPRSQALYAEDSENARCRYLLELAPALAAA